MKKFFALFLLLGSACGVFSGRESKSTQPSETVRDLWSALSRQDFARVKQSIVYLRDDSEDSGQKKKKDFFERLAGEKTKLSAISQEIIREENAEVLFTVKSVDGKDYRTKDYRACMLKFKDTGEWVVYKLDEIEPEIEVWSGFSVSSCFDIYFGLIRKPEF